MVTTGVSMVEEAMLMVVGCRDWSVVRQWPYLISRASRSTSESSRGAVARSRAVVMSAMAKRTLACGTTEMYLGRPASSHSTQCSVSRSPGQVKHFDNAICV